MGLIFSSQVLVNQNNYHNMLLSFFWSKVVREDYKKYYFQQDGASPHTSKKAQKYLRSKFGEKLNQEYIIHCQKIWMI